MATSPIEQPARSAAPSEREHQLALLLRTIVEAVSDGVAFLDGQCRLTFANAALRQLLGDGRNVRLGRRCCEALPLLSLEGTPLCTAEQCPGDTLPPDQPLRCPARLRAPDGRLRDLVLTFVRAGADGPVILVVHDLTELQQLDHLRSTFVSVISHELQTPIAIIKGYASTLGREDAAWDAETLRRGLEIIEEEADRLNDMVRNLLAISRIEAGALRLEFGPLQLRPLIERLARKMQVRPGRQRRIVVSVPSDLPQVVADKERIEEVLRNLLDNALKYSPPDSAVTVGAWATGTEVVVAVTDEGGGIAVEDRERAFEAFERLDTGLARRRPGAGLGLFICRAIVQAHGGRIWIERGPTGGTRVAFSLPREQKAQLPVATFLPLR
ncbi:MAG: PAS domain-containing protein [Chloroflexi bacterium]|nr:PAS domain-containing protein [Chloroflexota bacterium]